MRSFIKFSSKAACLVSVAIFVGLGHNVLRPDALPLIRKPLRETRAFATRSQMVARPKPVQVATLVQKSTPKDLSIEPAAPITDKPDNALKPVPLAKTVKLSEPIAKKEQPKPQPAAEALFTTLEDAKLFFDKGSVLFVDSRTFEDYKVEHVPGAVSLYHGALDKLYKQALGSVPKNRTIITYCSDPECKEATKVADELVKRGHSKVFILLEGLPGWIDAGYKTVKKEENIGG